MCRKPIGALHPVYLDLDLSTHSDKADLADLGDNPRAEEMVSARPFDSRHSQVRPPFFSMAIHHQ